MLQRKERLQTFLAQRMLRRKLLIMQTKLQLLLARARLRVCPKLKISRSPRILDSLQNKCREQETTNHPKAESALVAHVVIARHVAHVVIASIK